MWLTGKCPASGDAGRRDSSLLLIIRLGTSAGDGNGLSQIGGLFAEQAVGHILGSGNDLPGIPNPLSPIMYFLCSHSVGIDAQLFSAVQGAVEMVFLGDDDCGGDLKDILCPVGGFVGGESRMIHENIVGGDACLDGVVFHGLNFVVIIPAMVSGHQQATGDAFLVQADSGIQPVF